ncbi:MAG: hypothetical protein GY715_12770 [Planctomycetes bacterium]|nr:hypothetical protein [Planctomycetota bacterium]
MKWAAWLGVMDDSGEICTYEGAGGATQCKFRPSPSSIMRTFGSGQSFNVVSAEALLIEAYKRVDPIDLSTPPGGTACAQEILTIDPVLAIPQIGVCFSPTWRLNGSPVLATPPLCDSLNLAPFDLGPGTHTVNVTLTDDTTAVRDEAARAAHMTGTRTWTIEVGNPDLNGDGSVNFGDLLRLIAAWGPCPEPPQCCPADLDADGNVTPNDLVILLTAID